MPPALPHPRPVIALLLAAQAALVVVDVATGATVAFTSAYLTVPLALALVAPARTVWAAGALAFGLALASGAWNHFFLTADHGVRLGIVAAAAVLAALSARAREEALEARRENDQARRVADAAREQLDAMLGALAEAVTVHDEGGRTVYANDAAVRLLGAASVDEVLATAPGDLAARFTISYEDGAEVAVEDLPGRRAVLGEPAPALLTRSVHRASGRALWLLTKATVVRTADGELLAVNVIEDVTSAKENERRQRFLAEVGRALAFSVDPDNALERVARLSVPVLGDWCTIDVLDAHGRLRRGPLVHIDPDQAVLGRDQPGSSPHHAAAAQIMAGGPAVRRRTAILAPLRIGGHTLGVITVATAQSVRAYDESDLAFVSDLAVRLAVAVDNARLSADRAQAAATLQRSLLPERLPDIEGLATATSYRPGDRASEVGGDFYDLFRPDGEAMVVLGDVTGKGVDAAALTAQVRHTARTAARFDPRPSAVLTVVDEVLREHPALSLVSAVCARLRETDAGVEVDLASGGHPLPLLLGADGTVRAVGRPGVLLGAAPGGAWPETTLVLEPGATLLFYTDGVTDAPGDGERFGDERLRRTAAAGPRDPSALVERVDAALEEFRRGRTSDDRALLALGCVGPVTLARPRTDECRCT